MKIDTLIKELEPLLERRKRVIATLRRIKETKTFLKLTIEGENGNEQTSSVSFTWEDGSPMPQVIRDFMLKKVEDELVEVETLIEAIN